MTNAPTTTQTDTTNGSSPVSGGDSTHRATSEARTVADTGKQGVGLVADEARSQAAGLARAARDEARHRADGEIGKLAGFLSGLGDELAGMADGSTTRDGHLQGLARDGARAANRLSQRLEMGGLDGAVHDLSMFARRRPGVFLAAAFGVGVGLGRLTRNADVHSISRQMHSGDDDMQPSIGDESATGTPSTQLGPSPTGTSAESATPTTGTFGSTPPTWGDRP
jgi:hypothetical protein